MRRSRAFRGEYETSGEDCTDRSVVHVGAIDLCMQLISLYGS